MSKFFDTLKSGAALPVLHSHDGGQTFALRANLQSEPITDEERDDLLARCNANQYVELFLEILAFEQTPDISNANFVRFADAKLASIAASGNNSVFLSDHQQYTLADRGGTIVASAIRKVGATSGIVQTVKLTHPVFVAMALRGLIDRFSIGWQAVGTVLCTVCNTAINACSHYPGRMYEGKLCEVVFPDAKLIETSAVNVPAVRNAQLIGIRSAAADHDSAKIKGSEMKHLAILASFLGLAATATDEQIDEAVAAQAAPKTLAAINDELTASQKDLRTAQLQIIKLTADNEADKTTRTAAAIDALVADAVQRGKLAPGSENETALREVAAVNLVAAQKLMGGAAPAATLVGAPNQSRPTDQANGPTDQLAVQMHEDQQIIAELAAAHRMSPVAYAEMLSTIGIDTSAKIRAHALLVANGG